VGPLEQLVGVEGVEALGNMTFESGQMLVNKERAWAGLLLAAHFNLEKKAYFRMVSLGF
jgi:hypothetical protein